MVQFNVTNEFSFFPATTAPVPSATLPVNANRKFLQVSNNGTTGNIRIKFDQNFNVPANEVETLTFPGSPNAGTFTVTDWHGNTTAAQPVTVTAAALQTALQALGAIGAGNCTVTGSVAAGFVVTFGGTLADTTIPAPKLTMVSSLQNTTSNANAVQLISWSAAATAGTFELQDSLGNSTAPLAFNATALAVQTALNALPGINGSVSNVVVGASSISVTFGNAPLADGPVPLLVVTANTQTNNATLVSNIQTLFAEPQPVAGTFELMFGGLTTAPLAFDATAAQIQTAFQALASVGAANCIVSGLNFVSGFSFAFTGALANAPQQTIQVLDGPESQYGAVNGGTSPLRSVIDPTNDIQKVGPDDVSILVVQEVLGVGPAPVTSTVTTTTPGFGPLSTTATVAVTTPGVTNAVDGLLIPATQSKMYDYATPVGALYVISDTVNLPVQILEG